LSKPKTGKGKLTYEDDHPRTQEQNLEAAHQRHMMLKMMRDNPWLLPESTFETREELEAHYNATNHQIHSDFAKHEDRALLNKQKLELNAKYHAEILKFDEVVGAIDSVDDPKNTMQHNQVNFIDKHAKYVVEKNKATEANQEFHEPEVRVKKKFTIAALQEEVDEWLAPIKQMKLGVMR